MATGVTDIWFRSALPLDEIAARLGLSDITHDVEDYWEWVIGTLAGAQLDITRTYTQPPRTTDTRIFLTENTEFSNELITEVVSRLRDFVSGTIAYGRWESRSGNEYALVVIRDLAPFHDRRAT